MFQTAACDAGSLLINIYQSFTRFFYETPISPAQSWLHFSSHNVWADVNTWTKCNVRLVLTHKAAHGFCLHVPGQQTFSVSASSSSLIWAAGHGLQGNSWFHQQTQPFPYLLDGNGQGESYGFPQKLLCVDSLWGGVLFTPTVSFLLGSDCQAYRRKGVYEKRRRELDWCDVKGGGI